MNGCEVCGMDHDESLHLGEQDEIGEDLAALLAAIYEATCADCMDAHPTQLCCRAFYCVRHYRAHAYLYHPDRAEVA